MSCRIRRTHSTPSYAATPRLPFAWRSPTRVSSPSSVRGSPARQRWQGGSPKLHFLDSGLLASLRRIGVAAIARNRQTLTITPRELRLRRIYQGHGPRHNQTTVSHYRDKDGIEIKAAATALPRDFRGLRRLRDVLGDGFVCGIVLHDGERIQQVSSRLFAIPFRLLWEA